MLHDRYFEAEYRPEQADQHTKRSSLSGDYRHLGRRAAKRPKFSPYDDDDDLDYTRYQMMQTRRQARQNRRFTREFDD